MITVIDDWLSGEEVSGILKVVGDEVFSNWGEFPLYFQPFVATPADNQFNGFFTHLFYDAGNPASDHRWIIDDIVYPKYLNRGDDIIKRKTKLNDVKVNVFTRTNELETFGFHSDLFGAEHNSLVYFLNDCDGYLLFDDGSKIRQKSNRVVIITDGHNYKHASTSTTDTKVRANINMVLS